MTVVLEEFIIPSLGIFIKQQASRNKKKAGP
jgi:hypothetical protein